ncbi:MAG: hypothetical protein NT051_02025 [Candidatus Micrarchaeota archaeon]|nr:hypothetical protein [Candidatus Micrarchaeota archaeon]
MRARIAILALLLVLLLSAPQFAQSGAPGPDSVSVVGNDLRFKVIQSLSVWNNTATVQVKYVNYSHSQQRLPDNYPQSLQDYFRPANSTSPYSNETMSISILPLAGAPIYFTLNGNNVTNGDGDPICNPARTDSTGVANCTMNLTGLLSCAQLTTSYRGESGARSAFQKSSESTLVCPQGSQPLSALSHTLWLGISANMYVCFPALLIMGLLLSSMYYAGRDPLSLFDITTPKIPKPGKTFKVTGGTAPMMLRSLSKTLANNARATRMDIKKVTEGYLDVYSRAMGWSKEEKAKQKSQLQKELKELMKEHAELTKKLMGADPDKYRDEIQNLVKDYLQTMERYSPNHIKQADLNRIKLDPHQMRHLKNAKDQFDKLVLKDIGEKFAMNLQIESMKKGFGARARPGGKFKRFGDKVVEGVTAGQSWTHERIEGIRVPLVGSVIRKALSVPTNIVFKGFDAMAQQRSSTLAVVGSMRDLNGALWYRAGRGKSGRLNVVGKAHRYVYEQSLLGKLYQKYHSDKETEVKGQTWAEYEKKYNVPNKKASNALDALEDHRVHSINDANNFLQLELDRLYTSFLKLNSTKGTLNPADLKRLSDIRKMEDSNAMKILRMADLLGEKGRKANNIKLAKDGKDRYPDGKTYDEHIREYAHSVAGVEGSNGLLVKLNKKTGRYVAETEGTISDEINNQVRNERFNRIRADIKKNNPGLAANEVEIEVAKELRAQKNSILDEIKDRKAIAIKEFNDKYAGISSRLTEELAHKDGEKKYCPQKESLQDKMIKFANEINIGMLKMGKSVNDAFMSMNLFGKNPTGAALTVLLGNLLFKKNGELLKGIHPFKVGNKTVSKRSDLEVSDMVVLEELFNKGSQKIQFRQAITEALNHRQNAAWNKELTKFRNEMLQVGKRGIDKVLAKPGVEVDLLEAMMISKSFGLVSAKSASFCRTSLFANLGSSAEEVSIAMSPSLKGAYVTVSDLAKLHESLERAVSRTENKLSDYGRLKSEKTTLAGPGARIPLALRKPIRKTGA